MPLSKHRAFHILFIVALMLFASSRLAAQHTVTRDEESVKSTATSANASAASSASPPASSQTQGIATANTPATGAPSSVDESKREASNADEHLPFLADARNGSNEAEAPSAVGLLARTVGALLLIVGLIVAVGWSVKRFGGARFGQSRADAPELAVLASVALGDKRSLAIVRFGDKTLLVGSTTNSITLLADEDAERLSSIVPAPPPPARSVADMLKADMSADVARSSFDYELTTADARYVERQASISSSSARDASGANGGAA